MAKKDRQQKESNRRESKFVSNEELHNMKLNLSIEIPKEDFDKLLKAMLGHDGIQNDNTN